MRGTKFWLGMKLMTLNLPVQNNKSMEDIVCKYCCHECEISHWSEAYHTKLLCIWNKFESTQLEIHFGN